MAINYAELAESITSSIEELKQGIRRDAMTMAMLDKISLRELILGEIDIQKFPSPDVAKRYVENVRFGSEPRLGGFNYGNHRYSVYNHRGQLCPINKNFASPSGWLEILTANGIAVDAGAYRVYRVIRLQAREPAEKQTFENRYKPTRWVYEEELAATVIICCNECKVDITDGNPRMMFEHTAVTRCAWEVKKILRDNKLWSRGEHDCVHARA